MQAYTQLGACQNLRAQASGVKVEPLMVFARRYLKQAMMLENDGNDRNPDPAPAFSMGIATLTLAEAELQAQTPSDASAATRPTEKIPTTTRPASPDQKAVLDRFEEARSYFATAIEIASAGLKKPALVGEALRVMELAAYNRGNVDFIMAGLVLQRGDNATADRLNQDAISDYNLTLKLNPNKIDAHYKIALCFERFHKWDEAMAHLKAIIYGPDHHYYRAYNEIGNVLLSRPQATVADLDLAIQCFKDVLEMKPGFKDAQDNLAKAMLVLKQFRASSRPATTESVRQRFRRPEKTREEKKDLPRHARRSAPPPPLASLGDSSSPLHRRNSFYLLAALHAGFVWDDDRILTINPLMQSPDGLRRLWFDLGAIGQYYPLSFSTLWLEYHAWGANPLGYHIDNILLHLLSTILLWQVLVRLQIKGAWAAALLFAIHPMQVESVGWTSERKNVLSGVFYFLSLLAYLRTRWGSNIIQSDEEKHPPAWGWYAASLALYACAMFSKTVTATLPAVILLLTWWKTGRIRVRQILPLLPMFIFAAILGSITKWMERNIVGAVGPEFDWITPLDRICIAGRVLWFYLCKLIWPTNLTFIYPRWNMDAGQHPWLIVFPIAAFAALLSLWLLRRRIGRGPLTATLFFAGTLFPALGFANVYPMQYSFVADHFQYLACIGVFVLFAAIISHWIPAPMSIVLLLAPAAVLAFVAHDRTYIFHDSKILWQDTLAKNPNSAMAHGNYGQELVDEKDLDGAQAEFEKAIELHPAETGNRINLGYTFALRGDWVTAAHWYAEALKNMPDSPIPVLHRRRAAPYYRLGTAYAGLANQAERDGRSDIAAELPARHQKSPEFHRHLSRSGTSPRHPCHAATSNRPARRRAGQRPGRPPHQPRLRFPSESRQPDPGAKTGNRKMKRTAANLLGIVLLLGAAFAAYWPAVHAGFIWDDNHYIQDNILLRHPDGLLKMWTQIDALHQYYPVTFLSFWIEYQIWGASPMGYHVDNIVLHALSAIMLWRLLAQLEFRGAFFVALLFAVHPVEVESVAWASERKNVLSGLLYMLSLAAYFRTTRGRWIVQGTEDRAPNHWLWYLLSLLLFFAALTAKSVTSTLPAVILLLTWWKRRNPPLAQIFCRSCPCSSPP